MNPPLPCRLRVASPICCRRACGRVLSLSGTRWTSRDLTKTSSWSRAPRAGEAGAFDELVVKYTPRLYGLVYNMTSNHEDTNDLLQDVFSKAYKSIGGFRGKSSFYTWIHSIAVNMTLNFLKKRGRRFHLSLDDVDASIQNDKEFLELTATSSPVREADLSELQRRLNEAMMKLSDEHRAVVTMFHIQGMPHAEISKILRVSEGTVRSRLFYANRQLQNYLDEFRKNPVS